MGFDTLLHCSYDVEHVLILGSKLTTWIFIQLILGGTLSWVL